MPLRKTGGSVRDRDAAVEQPLLDGFKTIRSSAKSKFRNPAEDENEPKATVGQLLQFASSFDKFLYAVGSLVAVITGCALPLMTIVFGDISDSFVKIQRLQYLHNHGIRQVVRELHWNETRIPSLSVLTYTMEDFSAEVVQNCWRSVYIGIAIFVVAAIQVACFLVACENLNYRLQRDLFKAVLRQDVCWFDKNQSGTLTAKIFDDLEHIKEGTGDKIALLIQLISQFCSGFIIAFTYEWKLTLIMISLSPFMIICGAFVAKFLNTATTREIQNYASAGAIAEEVLRSIQTVIAFNGQNFECTRYNDALKSGMKDGIVKSMYTGIGFAATFFIMFSSYCLAFWVGIDLVYGDEITPGIVMKVFFGVIMGSMALGNACSHFAILGAALEAGGAVIKIMDRKPEIDAYSNEGKKPSSVKGDVEFKSVSFAYPTKPEVEVLKDISFRVSSGETVAIVGPSGCGKSTIMSLLLRYYDPTRGQITIDGHNISTLNLNCLRGLIGVVPQEPVLFNCTILENLSMGKQHLTESEMITACCKANADNFINHLPETYETLVGDRGMQLSAGQKQRIAIARALVRNPKILLLDEAVSSLDPECEAIVREALKKAARGRTTLVIAHRLSTIKSADKILVIKEGTLVEAGSHESLMANKGYYYDMVNAEVFSDIEEENGQKDPVVKGKPSVYERQLSRISHVSFSSSGSSEKERSLSPQLFDSNERSGTATKAQAKEKEIERLKKDLEEENGQESNLFAILKFASPERGFIIFAVLVCAIQGCCLPMFSLFFAEIVNVFSKPKKELKAEGHFWALLLLILGCIIGLCIMCQIISFGYSSEKLTGRLRYSLFRTILNMDIAYFDMPRHSSNKISTRLATDASNVKSAINHRFGTVISTIMSVGCGICIAFYYGWQLAFLVIAVFPIGGFGHYLHVRYLQGRHRYDTMELEGSGQIALEVIEKIRNVHALSLHERFYLVFCRHLDIPHRSATRKAITQGFSYGFSHSSFLFLYALSFRFGLYFIVKPLMEPMHVLRVLFAISFAASSIRFATAYFPEYTKAKLAAGIIFKMLQDKPKIDNLSNEGSTPRLTGKINIFDLHFAYPNRPSVEVLKGLDLSINVGQMLAIVGSSGCGKSTVISLLERFYDPAFGSVLLDDYDIRELNPQYLRSQLALVSQEPVLFDCSIRRNIVYGLPEGAVSEEEIFNAARQANIHEFITDLPAGYETELGTKGTQLSSGQKQRIAIARALVRNPKVLLLDEVTGALDNENEVSVQDALNRASQGKTCIVVAQKLSTVVNADWIVVLKQGIIVEQGTHAELMDRKGAYYVLTGKQSSKLGLAD